MPVNHSSRHFIPAEGKERMHSFVAKKLASVFRGSESSRPALQAPPRTAQRVVALQKVPDRPPTEGGEGMIKSAPRPTVHIIDDDAHAPHALSCLLRSYGYSVQSYANATQFLRQNLGSEPACLVLDLKVPECNGLKLQEILSRGNKDLPVIFVSGEADIKTSVLAMKAGAVDFLTKPIDDHQLLSAVEIGFSISELALAKRKELERDQAAFMSLSPREQGVCLRIAQGQLNKQIAFEFGTSEKTIKIQRSNVMQKLGASSLPDVVRLVERLRAVNAIPATSAHPPYRRSSATSGALLSFRVDNNL